MRYTKAYNSFGGHSAYDTKYTYPGDYLVFCDKSGFPVPASQTRKEWNGMRVRIEDWDRRQPQDFVDVPIDSQAAPDPRPEGNPEFIDENPYRTIEDVIG